MSFPLGDAISILFLKGLERIKQTFRSHAGKRYGPQFIDIGLSIGEELYRVIQKEFDPYKQ